MSFLLVCNETLLNRFSLLVDGGLIPFRFISSLLFNPLSPKRDQPEISPYNINALENIVVMRIEYVIREDESN